MTDRHEVQNSRRHGRAEEDESEAPELEVASVLESLLEREDVGFGITAIGVDSGDDEGTLIGFEESGAIGEVDNEEAREDSERDRDDSEDDEDPLPSAETVATLEERDRVSDAADTDSRSARVCRKSQIEFCSHVGETGNDHRSEVEERHALLEFVAGEPCRDQVDATTVPREDTGQCRIFGLQCEKGNPSSREETWRPESERMAKPQESR